MRTREAERRARSIVYDRGGEWHDGAQNGLDLDQLCQIIADELSGLEPAHRDARKKTKRPGTRRETIDGD